MIYQDKLWKKSPLGGTSMTTLKVVLDLSSHFTSLKWMHGWNYRKVLNESSIFESIHGAFTHDSCKVHLYIAFIRVKKPISVHFLIDTIQYGGNVSLFTWHIWCCWEERLCGPTLVLCASEFSSSAPLLHSTLLLSEKSLLLSQQKFLQALSIKNPVAWLCCLLSFSFLLSFCSLFLTIFLFFLLSYFLIFPTCLSNQSLHRGILPNLDVGLVSTKLKVRFCRRSSVQTNFVHLLFE